MDVSELAARTMLGALDEPNRAIGEVLQRLDARKQTLSGGESVVLELALSMWNGSGQVSLYEALSRLDDINGQNLIAALAIKKPAWWSAGAAV